MASLYRIIAVDPGVGRVGIAILERRNGKDFLIHSECNETSKELAQATRLDSVRQSIQKIIDAFKPEELALETLYFSKNKKTALMVAEGRGVILGVAAQNKLPVFEYAPVQIKVAVTGHGGSDKKQVQDMVTRILKMDSQKRIDDEYDAIATGLTHLATRRFGN